MKKIIAAILMALALVVGLHMPAQAATSGLSCNTSNTTGALQVVNNNGLWAATGWVGDSGSHQWGWEIYHEGSRLANAAGALNVKVRPRRMSQSNFHYARGMT